MSPTTNDTPSQHGTTAAMPGQASDSRHISSQPTLLPPSPSRPSQLLSSLSPNSRPGSRSPTSIPSSPTSIRSSSSAIFERDIEVFPSALPSPHSSFYHPPNPHRTPRSRATEQIEQSVPSVLAEAASALAASSDTTDISVIAPAPLPLTFSHPGSVGSRSPPMHSRSPSPTPSSRKVTLPPHSTATSVNGSPARPTVTPPRRSTGPVTPGACSPSTPAAVSAPSPIPSPITATAALPPPIPATVSDPTSSLHGSSTPSIYSKRLSFISYSDLLSSIPITSLPLSSFTSPHSAAPPPHLPAVSAAAIVASSPSSAQSQGAPSRPLSTYSIGTSGGLSWIGGGGRGAVVADDQSQGVGKRLKDDIGGEWEREGFGKGLEERLEELMVAKA